MRFLFLTFLILISAPVAANQAALLRCAAELKQIHPDEFDSRLFFTNGLLIGSARVSGGQALLFISNERVSMAYPLKSTTTRLRINFPHSDPRRDNQTYFIQYTHSDVFGSRLGEAHIESPAAGRAPSDYAELKPASMPQGQVKRQILQLVAGQIHRVSELHSQGKLGKADLLAGNLSLCRGLGGGDEAMAKWLDRQIGELELASSPARMFNRSPAGFR